MVVFLLANVKMTGPIEKEREGDAMAYVCGRLVSVAYVTHP